MFSNFSINQRLMILVAAAAAIAGVIALALWTQQPDMQVLFTKLTDEDAAGIVEKLKEAKVPYETAAGGSTIRVPSGQVHDLRLQLTTQGLPRGGGVGYEIFDRTSIGMSEFVQKLNYRRALQGELARTIAQMPEVERARVHLALPERRLFASEQDHARASIVLSLRSGQVLSKTQVQGVVHLVASSVEGLQTRDVTIVDGHGRLLSSAITDDTAGLSNTQLEYQRTVEKDIESRIQSMLERIVGANKAVVRVSTLVDFRKVETTEERYDPNGQVVRSEQRGQEKSNGVNAVSGGVPGVQSNVPAGTAEPEGGQSSTTNSQTKNETVNYEISRTVSRIVEPVGTIKKLSVAVLVDGLYEAIKSEEAGAESTKKYVPRSDEDMKRIEDIVKKAMGYSAERQDQVEVVNVPFDVGSEEAQGTAIEAPAEPAKSSTPTPWYIGGALAFLGVLFVVARSLLAKPGAAERSGSETGIKALPTAVGGDLAVTASLEAKHQEREEILALARKNPDTTAVVLKQWLKSTA